MKLEIARSGTNCHNCGFCDYMLRCTRERCTGCGACVIACPYNARVLVPDHQQRQNINISINGRVVSVPERITILKALELNGYKVAKHPHHHQEGGVFAPCQNGGCWACAVVVDGVLMPSCTTSVKEGMQVSTDKSEIEQYPPHTIVTGLSGSPESNDYVPPYTPQAHGFVEVSYFCHGCNLNCTTCHNWNITFSSVGNPTPAEYLAHKIIEDKPQRVGISGGEPTLNRRWLINFITELKKHLPELRIQLDTNATLLTSDYIDALVEAGLTDISPDLKGASVGTFMHLTGMQDEELAWLYLDTQWQAVRYLIGKYTGIIWMVIGLPYHPEIMSLSEYHHIGKNLAKWDPGIPVNIIELGGAFRDEDLREITPQEMLEAKNALEEAGLTRILFQERKYLPKPLSRDEVVFGSEYFARNTTRGK